MQLEIVDDLEALVRVLPPRIQQPLSELDPTGDLLEIVLDLGRKPEARLADRDVTLAQEEVTTEEIAHVVERIGTFGDDNRAGIARTLHRISAIRNREGRIVGLTCRVGRAVYGTIDIIRDIVESGKSILLLGRPGVGKTTMLREVARVLAEGRRVIIVDTSNEIAGDGDIPHPAIGHARRMQVVTPTMQHAVMIEAVENHMPEVIVIDEIGTELEAAAARTIAERGVQLVGTAHGNTLENLMMNPTLADLVGGIQSVTLSDEEARRRGTQKSVLERKAPPTFDVVVEIQDWGSVAVRHDVGRHVDAILRGRSLPVERRYRDQSGEIRTEEGELPLRLPQEELVGVEAAFGAAAVEQDGSLRVYPYGISQTHLRQAARNLAAQVDVVAHLPQAEILMTTKAYYRRRPKAISEAERRGIPIYVLRSNTIHQVESVLSEILGREARQDPFAQAMDEARRAIRHVLRESSPVELSPQNAYIRRLQHQLAEQANLATRSRGREPHRRVTILPDRGH